MKKNLDKINPDSRMIIKNYQKLSSTKKEILRNLIKEMSKAADEVLVVNKKD